MLRKKRILFMPASCGEAHLYNCMQLGKALKTEGHKIDFAIGSSQLHTASNFGISKVYEMLDNCYLAESEWNVLEIVTKRNYIERCLSEEKEVIEKFKPDLIVTDFRFTAGISAYIHDIPWVSILAHLWYLPGYRSILQDTLNRAGIQDISAEQTDLECQQLGKKLNWIFQKLKMPKITDLMQIYISPFCTMIRTIPPFIGNCLLPSNFQLVGPFFPRPSKKQPIKNLINKLRDLKIKINPNSRTIIVRLSVLERNIKEARKWIEVIIKLFKNTEFQLLIVDKDLKTTCDSKNVFITSFLPYDLVFQLQNIVLISTAGLNTSLQAMFWEVPSLNIATHVESIYNALILKELGTAEVLFSSQLTPKIIFEKINNLFSDRRYKLSLRKTKKYLRKFSGVTVAIKCLKEQHLI